MALLTEARRAGALHPTLVMEDVHGQVVTFACSIRGARWTRSAPVESPAALERWIDVLRLQVAALA